MTELLARNGGRAGVAALTAILLLGLGLRVDDAWEGRAPVYDAVAYSRIAANLEEGHGFTLGKGATQSASNYSPGLPLLTAGLYELSGGIHERFARIVLALVGALSVLFAYLIGRRLSGVPAGLIGAGLVAIYPALLEYQGMLMSEPLAATLLSGAILAMLWAANGERTTAERAGEGHRDRARAPRWLLSGLLLGALALVRPEYLGVAVLLSVVVFATGLGGNWRRALGQAAMVLLGVGVIVAPWTIRNAIALDRFVPISTGGGQVLFAGSYLPSDGDPERVGEEVLRRHPGLLNELADRYLRPRERPASPPSSTGGVDETTLRAVLERVRLEQILAALAAQRYPGLESDQALSRMGRERLWRAVNQEPTQYAGFLTKKIARVWAHGPRNVMRQPGWEALHGALVALGLIGLVLLAWRRRWEALLLATVLLSITAIGALLVASPRRVLVLLPLLAPLAGFAILWLYEKARGGEQRSDERRSPTPLAR